MTTEVATTAEIIQFPARGRFATAQNVSTKPGIEMVSGSALGEAWYHDAAIRDSKRAGER